MSNGKIFKCVQTYQIKLTRYSNYVACNHINKIAECRTNRYTYIGTKKPKKKKKQTKEKTTIFSKVVKWNKKEREGKKLVD